MKRWGLMTMAVALTAAACGTTTMARAGDPHPSPLPQAGEGIGVDEQPEVVIVATSPTNVQFRADAGDVVVPLRRARPPTMSPRKVRVREGMLIGAAVGVVAGFLLGAADDSRAQSDPDASCDHCFEVLGATVYGAIGLGLGAAVAAIIPNGNP